MGILKEIIPLFKITELSDFPSVIKDYYDYKFIKFFKKEDCLSKQLIQILKVQEFNKKIYQGVAQINSIWPGINEQEEVLVSPTIPQIFLNAVKDSNLKINGIDTQPDSLNICLLDFESKLTRQTKIIFLNHHLGCISDLKKVASILELVYHDADYKPVIVEIASFSIGSKFNFKDVGLHGNLTVFYSDDINKYLGTNLDFVLCPHKRIYNKLNQFYSSKVVIGESSKFSVYNMVKIQQENAAYYDLAFKDVKGIQLLDMSHGHTSAFWTYSFLVQDVEIFKMMMEEMNIIVGTLTQNNYINGILPAFERVKNKFVSIPCGWWLSDSEREYIINCIKIIQDK